MQELSNTECTSVNGGMFGRISISAFIITGSAYLTYTALSCLKNDAQIVINAPMLNIDNLQESLINQLQSFEETTLNNAVIKNI